MNVLFVCIVNGFTYNLAGVWGPFYSEPQAKKFMLKHDMPDDTYKVIMLNRGDSLNGAN